MRKLACAPADSMAACALPTASWTPRIDAIGVDRVRIAYQFIQGGTIRLTHCGRMIIHSVWRRVKARLSEDSHWPPGIERMAPRTISETFAITGRERPIVALIQAGMKSTRPAILI